MISADDETKVSLDAVVEYFVDDISKNDPKAANRTIFKMADINKDGTISKTELGKYFKMEGSGIDTAILQEMIAPEKKVIDSCIQLMKFGARKKKINMLRLR